LPARLILNQQIVPSLFSPEIPPVSPKLLLRDICEHGGSSKSASWRRRRANSDEGSCGSGTSGHDARTYTGSTALKRRNDAARGRAGGREEEYYVGGGCG